ncbi:MAG: hypothetical protein RIB49_18815 [Rhodospirillales bacterium]
MSLKSIIAIASLALAISVGAASSVYADDSKKGSMNTATTHTDKGCHTHTPEESNTNHDKQ